MQLNKFGSFNLAAAVFMLILMPTGYWESFIAAFFVTFNIFIWWKLFCSDLIESLKEKSVSVDDDKATEKTSG